MTKTLVILAALLVPASALRAQNWDADHDRLVAEFRQQHYEEVLKLSTGMLVTYDLPEFVGEIYTRRVGALRELKRWDDLAAEAGRLDAAAWAADRKVLADVLLRFAGALRQGKETRSAIDVYRIVLAKCPKETSQCAAARVAVGDCYAYDLKDTLAQAIPEYLAVEKDYPGEGPAVALAVQHLAETWWRLGDFRKAKDTCARALARYRAEYPASHVEQLATRIGEACVQLNEPDRALEAYREAEETYTTRPEHKSELAWRRATILFEGKRYAEAAVAYRRVVARYALVNEGRSIGAAQAVVDCFAAIEKHDEALRAARVVYDYGDRHWAVPKIIELLRLSGTDDEQVEAFVRFQLYGPKGEDGEQEIANPFNRIGYPDYDDAVRKDFETSIASLGDDWSELRRKGRLCLLWGKPREAVGFLHEALLAAPAPQVAALGHDLVGRGVSALQGTEAGWEPFYDYLRGGPEAKEVDAAVTALLARQKRAADDSAKLKEGLDALGGFITGPFSARLNRRDEARMRTVMLRAYQRVAAERGREDRLLGLCLDILKSADLPELHVDCVRLASRALRLRDGHLAGEFRFLEEAADPGKSPNVAPAARNAVRQHLNQLASVKSWERPQKPDFYRRFLPKKPAKSK